MTERKQTARVGGLEMSAVYNQTCDEECEDVRKWVTENLKERDLIALTFYRSARRFPRRISAEHFFAFVGYRVGNIENGRRMDLFLAHRIVETIGDFIYQLDPIGICSIRKLEPTAKYQNDFWIVEESMKGKEK